MNLLRKTYIPASLLMLLAGGCSDSYPDLGPDPDGEITITLCVPGSDNIPPSRAGGEDGDGRVEGFSYENAVTDANIFFFIGSGLNAPDDTEVTGIYVPDMSLFSVAADSSPFEKKIAMKIRTVETELKESGILDAEEVSFITVLNAGADLHDSFSDLKSLREYTGFTASSTLTGKGYGSFVMTTAYDAPKSGIVNTGNAVNVGANRLVKDSNAPAGKGWKGAVTVQRLCARVELAYTPANAFYPGETTTPTELVYATPAGNKIHVTNILPVNFMANPSYLIRKVTKSVPSVWNENSLGEIVWGGIEASAETSGYPANYVIEPTTLAKAAGGKSFSSWFGNSAAASVTTDLLDAGKGKVSDYLSIPLSETDASGCDRISIIGYPDENTQAPGCYSSDYISGIALRALFQPAKLMVRSGADFTETAVSDNDWRNLSSAGKTFWRYQPSVKTSGITDSEALYFRSEADALDYKASHSADLATITEFENGLCFYTVWVRHYSNEDYKVDNTAPKESYPMEFAVVRNNIYSIVLSFSGPGDPAPLLREPDTMMSRIFVRKWNLREEKNPLQF